MFGGAECSTGRNPLAQLAKIDGRETQHHQDRLSTRLGPIGREGLRTSAQDAAAVEQNMMEFAQQQGNPAFQFPDMHIDPLHAQPLHHQPLHQHPIHQQPAGAGWIDEFHSLPQGQAEPAFHPAQMAPGMDVNDFAQFQQHAQHQLAHQQAPIAAPRAIQQVPGQAQFYRPPQGYQLLNRGLAYTSPYHTAPMHLPPQPTQLDKGKEKGSALDDQAWETQFKQLELNENVTDDLANQAINEELQHQPGLFNDFDKAWQEAEKAAEFNPDWIDPIDSQKPWTPDISSTKSMPTSGDYMFEPENPYMTMDDPFLEGKRLMESGGNLSLAALSFEAAVQKNENHVEAWTMLGSCQAQNEKETPAIRALERALELDPQNLTAMMGLAVSYTNEGYDTTAYAILERWISTKYPALTKDSPPTTTIERNALQERVTDLFIAAAQLSPDGEQMDSDVQVGLGVLFYGAEEYDKAVDCFNAALSFDYDARDKNHLLWNRLGATLANSGRSEEAINAYERALTINPNFTRARYNLGVSCINIGCFEQAAQHLLGALAMHKVAEDKAREDARAVGMDPDRIVHNQSTNLFDTLRRVFSQMGRTDLANKVSTGMDVDVFRGEFDF